jgi:hypothetical protein
MNDKTYYRLLLTHDGERYVYDGEQFHPLSTATFYDELLYFTLERAKQDAEKEINQIKKDGEFVNVCLKINLKNKENFSTDIKNTTIEIDEIKPTGIKFYTYE